MPVPVTWALLNLICAILSVVISLFVLLRYLGGKKDDDKEQPDTDEGDAKKQEIKRRGLLRLIDVIPAIAAVVTFILTEDISSDMVLVDQWTLLMVVILAIDALLAVFTRKTTKEEDDEQQNSQA